MRFCCVLPCRNDICMLDRSNVHALLRYLSYCDCSMESKYHRSVETDLVGTSSTMVHRLRWYIVYDGTSSTLPTVIVPWEVCTTDQYMLLICSIQRR